MGNSVIISRWLLRLLILSPVILGLIGWVLYARQTQPEVIERLVRTALRKVLPDVDVQMEGAEWKFLGGLRLKQVVFSRSGKGQTQPIITIPEIGLHINKSELAQGRLALKKVECNECKLMLVRNEDGKWNLAGLFPSSSGPSTAKVPLVKVTNGQIQLHDQMLQFPDFILNRVTAQVSLSDEGGMHVTASGESAIFGPLKLEAIQADPKEPIQLSVRLERIEWSEAIANLISRYYTRCVSNIPYLARNFPEFEKTGIDLSGVASAGLNVAIYPEKLSFDDLHITGQLHRVKIQHPQLPAPLEELQFLGTWKEDGISISHLQAKCAGGQFRSRGEFSFPSVKSLRQADGNYHLEFEDIQLKREHYFKLSPLVREFCEDFEPLGKVSGVLDVGYKNEQVTLAYTVKPQNGSFRAKDIPYPAHSVTGELAYSEGIQGPKLKIDLSGFLDKKPFTLTGHVIGEGLKPGLNIRPSPGMDLEIRTQNIPIDGVLDEALGPLEEIRDVLRQFHAQGRLDVTARVRREASPYPNEKMPVLRWIQIGFHDVAFRYDKFQLPVENVSGRLKIEPDQSWTLNQLTGQFKGGDINADGWMVKTRLGNLLHLDVHARSLSFEREVYNASPQEVKTVWDQFQPQGRIDCDLAIDLPSDTDKPVIELEVRTRNCSVRPRFLPYQLDNINTSISYNMETIRIPSLRAWHGNTRLVMGETLASLQGNKGLLVQMRDVRLINAVADSDLLRSLPPILGESLGKISPSRPINLSLEMDVRLQEGINPISLNWKGEAQFRQCDLNVGMPLQNVTGMFTMLDSFWDGAQLESPGFLAIESAGWPGKPMTFSGETACRLTHRGMQFTNTKLNLHQVGSLSGCAELVFGDDLAYRLFLKNEEPILLSPLLQKWMACETAQSGFAKSDGKLHGWCDIRGKSSDLASMEGKGFIELKQGSHLYSLPGAAAVIDQLSKVFPKANSHQEISIPFTIAKGKVFTRDIQLMDDAFSVYGEGSAGLDGKDLDINLHALLWGRVMPDWPKSLKRIPEAFSESTHRIQVTGSLDQPKINVIALPWMTDPFRKWAQR